MDLLVTAFFLLAQPVALGCTTACPCIVPAGVDWRSARVMAPRAQREAVAIFLGIVVGVDTLARDTVWMGGDSSPGRRPIVIDKTVQYRFSVQRIWKGNVRSMAVVMDPHAGTSCGRRYRMDGMYLVYAERDREVPGGLETSSCSRVKPEGDIQDDLQILGAGEPPKR
jgi:hypothetical protein